LAYSTAISIVRWATNSIMSKRQRTVAVRREFFPAFLN